MKRAGNSWKPKALLLAPDGAAADGFGTSVRRQEDHAVVGATATFEVLAGASPNLVGSTLHRAYVVLDAGAAVFTGPVLPTRSVSYTHLTLPTIYSV